jgi:hypothetical protein
VLLGCLICCYFAVLRDFRTYTEIFMNVCCSTVTVIWWWSFVVKVFRAFWDNIITVPMEILLMEGHYVHVLLYIGKQHFSIFFIFGCCFVTLFNNINF